MDKYFELTNKLRILLKNESITPITQEEKVDGIKPLQLRDTLLLLGDILEEDLDKNIYVASIKSGLWNLGHAYVAACTTDDSILIASYANEGIIKQHMAENTINNIVSILKNKQSNIQSKEKIKGKNSFKQKKHIWIFGIIALLLATVSITIFLLYSKIVLPFEKSSKDYNIAVTEYNSIAESYNLLRSEAFLENLNSFNNTAPILNPIATDFKSLLKSYLSGNTKTQIKSDIDTLKEITSNLNNDISSLHNIVNPKASFIFECLKRIDGIVDIGNVSTDNDPNQMIGKEGGYTGCVYFTLSDVDAKTVVGKDAIEKGTDGGGAVEIYATKEDALARCDYLSQFKDTIIYSGSYAAVGTLVIRTSYYLDDQKQFDYTSKIVECILGTQQ